MSKYFKLIGVIVGGLVIFGLDKGIGLNAGQLGIGDEVRELIELAIMGVFVYAFPANSS